MARERPYSHIQLDATSAKVLAHPLRSRLLGALRTSGPATATSLAGELGTNSGATSYHLRKLESVGLVEDTDEGVGKERLWRASTESHGWQNSDFAGDEDAETALNWLVRDYARQFVEKYDRWLDVEADWPARWRDATGMTDTWLVVRPDQLEALNEELEELVERYRRAGEGDPDARRMHLWRFAFPLDLDQQP